MSSNCRHVRPTRGLPVSQSRIPRWCLLTLRASSSNQCDGSFNMDTGLATCKNWFNGCQCQATGQTCGPPQSCDNNQCGGQFDVGTGLATCRNFFQGCQCLATGQTCGAWASCDGFNCQGSFDGNSNIATCKAHFAVCISRDLTCMFPVASASQGICIYSLLAC